MTPCLGLRPLLLVCWFGLNVSSGFLAAQDKKADDKKADPPAKQEDMKPDAKKPPASADMESFRCLTADGVELMGDFYRPPASVGKRAPCVILLHAVGPNRETASRKDFGDLPKKLQKAGLAVISFDFRGYGESKNVDPQKYARAHRLPAGATAPRKLDARNFRNAQDYVQLVNDLIAIKIHLAMLNNEGNCNAHQVGLVGIEQGALIGLMWLYNEHIDENRIKDIKPLRLGQPAKFEGEDVVGVVWISLNGKLATQQMNSRVVLKWIATIREQTATLAFFGENDRDSRAFWNNFTKIIKPEQQKEAFENSDVKRLKNTNLTGHKLLDSAAFDIEKQILAFLEIVLVKPKKLWQEHKGGSREPSLADLRVIFG